MDCICAGIPIIVERGIPAAARFVEDNFLGIAIQPGDLMNLRSLVDNLDYAKLRENVCAYADQMQLRGSQIESLVRFYRLLSS
jgi:hypothetical protein